MTLGNRWNGKYWGSEALFFLGGITLWRRYTAENPLVFPVGYVIIHYFFSQPCRW